MLGACRLKELGGNITPQDSEHLQGFDRFFHFHGLRNLFRCGTRKRAVGQKLDDLLDVKLVIFCEAVVEAKFFHLEPLQDVGVVCAAFVLGDCLIKFRAGRFLKRCLILVKQTVELIRDRLALLRGVGRLESFGSGEKVQF